MTCNSRVGTSKIIEASRKNRVCFITIPQFNEKDQHISEVI